MSIYEMIAQLEEYYDAISTKWIESEDPLERAELFGLLKGYKSSLIILRTHNL